MEYEVTIDFGDHAIQAPRVVKGLVELGLYLERIPGMMGFEINREVTVHIKTKNTRIRQTELPLEHVMTKETAHG